MSSWVKRKFEHLRKWREYAEIIAKASKDIDPNSKVYVFGGVAENRVTVLSDIDILIVSEVKESFKFKLEVFKRAFDIYGLPFDAPVELHVTDKEGFKSYLKYSKVIEIA
ncbi:nucleotidyltransferase domain-containing protein [Saccharolobus caldissimus]|uniref:DNA polymerase n=1 Tax=Saccharolobus caldissimus TaxID=1702097 RepID=A0AAQ4CVB2_9CREN|nr:nucleotidyltransferase domain-containing protein [Saccharolobus caldissimus]BDB99743.1 DNA polymerase [Saccharolobus caldissimus]